MIHAHAVQGRNIKNAVESKNMENKIKELEDKLKQKLLERGMEINEHGRHDNAVADSMDADIYILNDQIARLKKQFIEEKEKNQI